MFECLETLPTPDDINWKINEEFKGLEQFPNRPQLGNIWKQFAVAEVTERICLTPNNRIFTTCLLYTSPSPRDATLSRMPSSA